MDARSHTHVTAALRLCLHALLAGLLALVVVRAVGENAPDTAAVVAVTLLTAALYAAGAMRSPSAQPEDSVRPGISVRPGNPVRPGTRAGAWWLGGLWVLWAALLVLSPDALWVAFPLYFLQLHFLAMRWALPAVVVTAAAAITGFVAHRQEIEPGAFIGPLIGAAVAVATVLGYDTLFRESERRRELIVELVATRADLAEAERTAGTLAERERLAREIHDTLAQGLSSIQLLLRAAERSLPENAPAAPHVRAAREAAQANLAEARSFVRALTPPDLEHGSLAAALERLCARTTAREPHRAVRGQRHPGGTADPVRGGAAAHRPVGAGQHGAPRGGPPGGDHPEFHGHVGGAGRRGRRAGLRAVGGAPEGRARRTAVSGCGRCGRAPATLGGALSVESAPGQGTAVALTLPVAVAAQDAERTA
ncbi:two-component sensor histidine kinase [Streptomyces badius]